MKRGPYDVVAPISGLAVFHSAARRERKALLDFFDRLARLPATKSEWTLPDEAGRTNYQTAVGRILVTYWTDHAAREVRIVRLDRVD